jgi:hypothetical protein
MKMILAGCFITFCCNASSASTLMQESSWYRDDPTVEDFGGGKQVYSGVSTDDLTLVKIGQIVCGRFDSTIASFQPKTDDAVFVGFRRANGSAHVYFVDEWWGEPDPGEADITQLKTTIKWAMTRAPQRGYLDPDTELKPGEPDVQGAYLTSLRLGCAAIARDFGELNQNNANEALKKLNILLPGG